MRDIRLKMEDGVVSDSWFPLGKVYCCIIYVYIEGRPIPLKFEERQPVNHAERTPMDDRFFLDMVRQRCYAHVARKFIFCSKEEMYHNYDEIVRDIEKHKKMREKRCIGQDTTIISLVME